MKYFRIFANCNFDKIDTEWDFVLKNNLEIIMYKIEWDKTTRGVKFSSVTTENTLGTSPRPVFFEELDMLKLDVDFGWEYPRCQEPLMWCINKTYYYNGEKVFEAHGANIYHPAEVVLSDESKRGLTLEPVDIKGMLEVCKNEMFLIESEAIQFIRDVYDQYSAAKKSVENVDANQLDFEALKANIEKQTKRKMAIVKEDCDSFDIMPMETAIEQGKRVYQTTKIDKFLASFSGGKDSQVVLDLCTRAIPPSAFEVIYSDTGYELPTSLQLYETVQKYYKAKYPNLKFSTAKNHETVLNYWDRIGTPSDNHRWCCSIMKTGPLYRTMKIEGTTKQAKILTFDGVRAEESVARSTYNRIGKGVKHQTVINASPILYWTAIEIFLYLFKYSLPINRSYRQGMTRVGCLICPFSSEWNDMISNSCYTDNLKPFLIRIESITRKNNIPDVYNYIASGNWKRRAGGRGLTFPSHLVIVSNKPDLVIKCSNPQKNIITWLSAVGEYSIMSTSDEMHGELLYKKEIYEFSASQKNGETTITFFNTYSNPTLQGLLKRAIYKATYCINCETCEVECPSGALTILPEVHLNEKICTHCHKCLQFHEYGCIVASSLSITGNNSSNKMKLIGYNNFGIKEEWIDIYMSSPENFFQDNLGGLNVTEQLPNFAKWLVHAGILQDTKSKNITPLGTLLTQIYPNNPMLVWEIVWINLSYGSPIAKWYKESVDWNYKFTQEDLQELVHSDYPDDKSTTIRNIVYALVRTFKESPIGAMGLLTPEDKTHFIKVPYEDLSMEAIAYSLYKYGESKGIKSFRVSDLYAQTNTAGVYREFGTDKTYFEKQLRSLDSRSNRIITANLNMGLDHIALRDDITSVQALSIVADIV